MVLQQVPHYAAAGIPRLLLRETFCRDRNGVSVLPAGIVVLPWVWSYIQFGIDALSAVMNGDHQAASTFLFLFGLVERPLIPLGLHMY